MGKQKIFKRMKISDKHIIVSVIIAIVILMGILFRVWIGVTNLRENLPKNTIRKN
jgi:hypothetical protein